MKKPRRNVFVRFERRSTQQDDAGQRMNVWTKIGEGWVSVRSLSGSEQTARSGESSRNTFELTTAYAPSLALTSEDRINFGGRRMGIESIENRDEANREWVILCSEITSVSAQL